MFSRSHLIPKEPAEEDSILILAAINRALHRDWSGCPQPVVGAPKPQLLNLPNSSPSEESA